LIRSSSQIYFLCLRQLNSDLLLKINLAKNKKRRHNHLAPSPLLSWDLLFISYSKARVAQACGKNVLISKSFFSLLLFLPSILSRNCE